MDRTFNVLATLTIGSLIVTGLLFGIIFYQERSATTTLSSTLTFTLTIRPNQTLDEVTFLIPLPANAVGYSSVIAMAGAREITALPPDWNTTLVGTAGYTYLGISAARIPAEKGNVTPYRLTVRTAASRFALDTVAPEANTPVFRPRSAGRAQACAPVQEGTPSACREYEGYIFAQYRAVPDAEVEIQLELVGTNTWQSLGDHSGAYMDALSLSLHGPVQGWHTASGVLVTGIGEEFP